MGQYDRIFAASFQRVLGEGAYSPDFTGRFYQHFLATSPAVAERFANTDMSAQKTMLHDSLHILLNFHQTREVCPRLQQLAEIHSSRGRNIPPWLYDSWLDSLIRTLSELDPAFDAAVELSWRLALAPGIALMQFAFDQPLPHTPS